MLVTGAPSRRHALGARAALKHEFPAIHQALTAVTRGGPGWSYIISTVACEGGDGTVELRDDPASRVALTVDDEGALALAIVWRDQSRQTLPCWEIEVMEAVAPELPRCDGFTGTGQRCASCRIRKAMHA